ncbi:SIN3-HDAC complex-associated factor-like [Ruditapes philippinarum]|uniref:SIN3-HDAC complex-associated factor-like n=1 Tax=Ruditapes philippinarum TaxID=129788 RepID=UPI00295BA9B3|nr:SIN3-HDAC complex-associated factor-like [Ruditapes philippinarum]XP_060570657.1 SIN3-HDAC complex-associated factor-like [Ruditapes philippinarum]XP_060570658.1 SIN3-HDAC complex-associated factor-like [Ruditapes philippinarum]
MFSFHKPKIYRSNNGCCICRAKSSSSRFTDSSKYEDEFQKCFRIQERRCGEICNACVLLVKRWKKLPDGTNRHWNHVVDARAGPGTKSTHKIKKQLSPTMQKYKSPLKAKQRSSTPSQQQQQQLHQQTFSSIPSPLPEELSGYEDSLDKSDLFSQSMTDSEESDTETSQTLPHISHKTPQKLLEHQISPFLDLTYWKMTQVCCGTIFKGMNGEVLVDPTLLKPCWSCNKNKSSRTNKNKELKRSTSLEDTDSNLSAPSFNVADFYEANTPEPETPPESPPNSPKDSLSETDGLTTLANCTSKMNFVSNHSIPMEC